MRCFVFFGCFLLFISFAGCKASTPAQTTAAQDEPVYSLVQHTTTRIINHEKRAITPLSCDGALGLDIAAYYASKGPNFYKSAQAKRASFIASTYFSGSFIRHKSEIVSAENSIGGFDHDKLDSFFGNSVPSTYIAMCEENTTALNRVKAEIKTSLDILNSPTSDVDIRLSSTAKPLLIWLDWEIELALARVSDDPAKLRTLNESILAYAKTRTDSKNNLYAHKITNGNQSNNYRIFKSNQAKFDLLRTNVQIRLALVDNDKDAFFKAFKNYDKITKTLTPNKFRRGSSVFDGSHATIFSGDHYIKSMVVYHRLRAWKLLMDNEKIRPSSRPTYNPGTVTNLQIFAHTKPKDYYLEDVVKGFERLSRELSEILLYEDGAFLWALHQSLRYEFYRQIIAIQTVKKARTASHFESKNSAAHCHAYRAWYQANKVLPPKALNPLDTSWCTKPKQSAKP